MDTLEDTTQKTNIIYLTDEDAQLFIEFQKRYRFMKLLEELQVFKIKSGSVIIHLDNLGDVGSVDVHTHHRL